MTLPADDQATNVKTPSELSRMAERDYGHQPWALWGSYLPERQWGTVREDYSDDGDAWRSFPHDHARSRTYRWGEDGLLGICDEQCRLCFSLALWNGQDPILKERPFGLGNPEGNHGEDVKDYFYYLANTPTHIAIDFLRDLITPQFRRIDPGSFHLRRSKPMALHLG